MNNYFSHGPGHGVVSLLRQMALTIVSTIHARLELVAIELAEGKDRLIKSLLIVGVALICLAFALAGLLILICLSFEPQLRFTFLTWFTGILLFLAFILALIALQRSKSASFLVQTRQILNEDKALLERHRNEQKSD